jgi:PHD/YefM family antitoxin component YafN of YafNO toxin-antitoxin module
MRLKTISIEQLGLETAKAARQAAESPVLIRGPGKRLLVLRSLADDDLTDEIIARHPAFRASIRRARRRFAAGRGTSLTEAKRLLGV